MSGESLPWAGIRSVAAWCGEDLRVRVGQLAEWIETVLERVFDPEFVPSDWEDIEGTGWPGPGARTVVDPWGGTRGIHYGQSPRARALVWGDFRSERLERVGVSAMDSPDLWVDLGTKYGSPRVSLFSRHTGEPLWPALVGSLLDAAEPWWVQVSGERMDFGPWFRHKWGAPEHGGFALIPSSLQDPVTAIVGGAIGFFTTPGGNRYLAVELPTRRRNEDPEPRWMDVAKRLAERFPPPAKAQGPFPDLALEVLEYGTDEPERDFTLVLKRAPEQWQIASLQPLLSGWAWLTQSWLMEDPIYEVEHDGTPVLEWRAKTCSQPIDVLRRVLKAWVLVAGLEVDRLIIGDRYLP